LKEGRIGCGHLIPKNQRKVGAGGEGGGEKGNLGVRRTQSKNPFSLGGGGVLGGKRGKKDS